MNDREQGKIDCEKGLIRPGMSEEYYEGVAERYELEQQLDARTYDGN